MHKALCFETTITSQEWDLGVMKQHLEQECVRNYEGGGTTALNTSGNLWFTCIFCIACSSGHGLQKDTVELEEIQER